MNNQKQLSKTLQIILWLWFGTITSFVSVNVVNIVRLQSENKILLKNMDQMRDQIMILHMDIRNPKK